MTIVNARLSRDGHIADMFRPILAGILLLWLAACERQDTSRPVVDVHALAEQGETRLLLQSIDGTDDVDRRDVCYRTPLMLAAQYGHLDTVTQLIDAGAHVQLHEKGYYTALMLAAGNGHSEVVRRLADAGAAVDDVIPLWSVDETTGLWIEEGAGTVVASADSPTGLALRAEVAHFSWWNADAFVDGNAFLAGQTVEVEDGAVGGDLFVAGESVTLELQAVIRSASTVKKLCA